MTNDEGNPNAQMMKRSSKRARRHSDFVIPSTLDIRHSSLAEGLIANAAQLASLIQQIEAADRVAIDTEADSLHSYREKLCLVQISTPSAVILSNVEGSGGTASKVALPDGKPGLAASGGCVAAS